MIFDKTIPLNEFVTLQRGFDLPKSKRLKGRIPVIASTGIAGYHHEAKVEAPGVVIGRSGSIGGGQYIEESYWPLNTTLWVKDFKGHHPKYVYYLMKNIDFSAFNTGTGVPTLNRNHLGSLLVADIGYEKEKEIAELLSFLDTKIFNNTAMNSTLEKIATRIFQSWFINFDPVKANIEGVPFDRLSPEIQSLFPSEFEESEIGMIPKGWEVKSLDEIANLDTTSVKPHIRPDQTWVHYSIPSFDEKNYPIIELGSEIKSNKYAVKKNAILVSKLNPRFERTWFPRIEDESTAICSTEFMQLVMKNIDNWPYLLCMVKSNSFQALLNSTATGTTGSRQRAQPKEVIKFKVLMPNENLVERFSSVVKPIFERHQLNLDQINSLTKIRDKLLPRLLSGQITIEKANELMEEVC